ncbi:hypothetical protein P153DRAFT_121522 [Dothidotthia symphoricarpi CBS 119687]|uniref:Secreted protein n=1 Tax=Dothidotthia symphoricarpi CBS 119687 TaxID=1392245 RepID=A0A6A6A1U9_9PLEO|nr:uncharacterized protein P153DRAFT_121522 [Dothidotthia symphoricarpi CBS 119687]KAF2125153.1 hypothetical protein P153DRAFT_121522 [Dothidotthia symphoricarpi CBS 119687]
MFGDVFLCLLLLRYQSTLCPARPFFSCLVFVDGQACVVARLGMCVTRFVCMRRRGTGYFEYVVVHRQEFKKSIST